MAGDRLPRPGALIDAVEGSAKEAFVGPVWRVVRELRDVRQGSRSGGRWDDGTFDVLYTSTEENGALAEMHFHLTRGQPVMPSKVDYVVHELEVSLKAVLDLSDGQRLTDLGMDMGRFGQHSYMEREREYPTTQQIAEVAHFLDFDGILVPNARWPCSNLIVFIDRVDAGSLVMKAPGAPIDWAQFEKN